MNQIKTDIKLKNGKTCTFLSPTKEHGKSFLSFLKQTSSETDFLLRYEDEIKMSVEQEEQYLANLNENKKSILIGGFINNKLVASAGLSPIATFDRCIHRADLGITILKDYWNMGIGSSLMSFILETAKEMNYEQIELEVVTDNLRAFSLYKKFGFEVYGIRKNSFRYRDGHYCSCYLMSLSL